VVAPSFVSRPASETHHISGHRDNDRASDTTKGVSRQGNLLQMAHCVKTSGNRLSRERQILLRAYGHCRIIVAW
jgi:hypothetical protein